MVTHTNSSLYWSALKPRINIYALNDISYSSPIYTYNPFTDVGVSTKPVSLSFDSQTVNAGTFTVEIEDADSELDMDTFTKGNRIVIDCSKNGSTWQPAFKGLIRSSEQTIYAPTGRNFTLSGYSYIIRLNERVLNVVKESALSGTDYDRTDSNMFTNNLVENLLDDDQNYIFSSDDFDLYTLPSPADISTSSIQEWIPRLDAELVTVGSAIDSVLEYSNSLITVDLSTDKWAVYNPDLVTPLTQVFLITDNMVQAADDGDITMYPTAPYKYNVSYDYPDSGSKLIVALNTSSGEQCPDIIEDKLEPIGRPDIGYEGDQGLYPLKQSGALFTTLGQIFRATQTDMSKLSVYLRNYLNWSSITSMTAQVRVAASFSSAPGTQIGSNMTLYRDGIVGKAFPEISADDWRVGLPKGDTGVTGLTVGTLYHLIICNPSTNPGSSHTLWLKGRDLTQTVSQPFSPTEFWNIWKSESATPGGSFASFVTIFPTSGAFAGMDGPVPVVDMDFNGGILQGECGGGGGLATSEIPDPQFVVAHDLNATNRLGIVERAITSLPRHITTLQTINEFLYSKLYVSAKPRFTFDFPSVSMPNRVPKAGDLVTHVSRRAGVGLKGAPLQTGVIMSVSYNFDQGSDESLGLRNISLQTTGIRRGSY